jgi:hypothetical protein
LAWVMRRFELYLLGFLSFVRFFSPCSFFFLSSAISYKLVLGIPCMSVQFA